eukprot:733049-Rhodomonas_salina.2
MRQSNARNIAAGANLNRTKSVGACVWFRSVKRGGPARTSDAHHRLRVELRVTCLRRSPAARSLPVPQSRASRARATGFQRRGPFRWTWIKLRLRR